QARARAPRLLTATKRRDGRAPLVSAMQDPRKTRNVDAAREIRQSVGQGCSDGPRIGEHELFDRPNRLLGPSRIDGEHMRRADGGGERMLRVESNSGIPI